MVARWRDTRRSLCLRCTVFAAVTLLVWCTWLAAGHLHPASAAPVTINFDDPANGADSSSSSSFMVSGVGFDGGKVVDFSTLDPPLDRFPRSGSSAAATLCRAESSGCGLAMNFPSGQAGVSLFVGFVSPSSVSKPSVPSVTTTVGLRRVVVPVAVSESDNVQAIAFDSAGREVTRAGARMPTADPAPSIDTRLEVSSSTGAIRSVRVVVVGGPTGVFAVDDVEFEPAEPALVVTPRSVDFGPAQSGTIQRQTVTVDSTGNVPVSITSLGFSGTGPSDFRALDDGCLRRELPPKSRCTVEIQRLTSAAAGPDAALVLTDDIAGRHTVQLIAAAAPSKITTQTQGTGGTAVHPIGGSGSDDTLRTVVIIVLAAAALAALGTATYLWMRPSAPLHVVVLPAPTVQTLGGNQPPTTVTVRFDPSTGTVEWTDRSRE